MITFPVDISWPLSSGNFQNEKSIISEHYGFTDALIGVDLASEPDKTVVTGLCNECEGYFTPLEMRTHTCLTDKINAHVEQLPMTSTEVIARRDGERYYHVLGEDFQCPFVEHLVNILTKEVNRG